MKPQNPTPVIVVGAGLSGLACAEALARRNIPVRILEAKGRVAEPWRARHPQLRLNVHRHFAQLPGRPMPKTDGTYVRRDTVVRYLEAYAAALPVDIDYGVKVLSVHCSQDGWEIETTQGSLHCAHLVFATGRDRVPHIPDWPGSNSFQGEIIHAAHLGDVTRFNGKRVLVVGAGNSGGDVLNHLAKHAAVEVSVSIRYGPAVVPARVFGFPLHRAANLFAAMPLWLVDPAFRLTQRLFLGNLRRYGVTSHPMGGGTRLAREGVAFAIDDGFVSAIKSGHFVVHRDIAKFERDTVLFSDGRSVQPEVVIAATGYGTGLDTLVGHLRVLDDRGLPHCPAGEEDPSNPGLWFTGYRAVFQGYFHAAGIAGDKIADAIKTDLRNRTPSTDSGCPSAVAAPTAKAA